MPDTLSGRHVVVTAGPTIEPIDPVRFLSNRSSGKQGYAIAEALALRGADVTLISGPTALDDPGGRVKTRHVETAREMLNACLAALPADVFIGVAAVADWRPAEPSERKLKLDKSGMTSLALVENPDILTTIGHLTDTRPDLVIGFAAETHNVIEYARSKRTRKGCDWILANDVSGNVMGSNRNEVHLIDETRHLHWPEMDKKSVAERLASEISCRW